ncbi:hypothetical protein CSB45_15585 [candidate division KSB3 bacterium]|uniref:Uncharacterized protein n=1 Tax=candidate division KSB3 bacterium TaxID=2044937 RepID=A0A2G6E0E1_9BACT|nr:MAG: hypothetical protein CSB45_15585 [candidate division KSB3 bacterium]
MSAKPLNERYYGKAKDYILLADTLLALEADTFSRWEDGKLIASSESRLKPASAADLAVGDQSSAQSTTQGDIEEKISRNEQGLNNIESYDPEGRLRRKLTMRDGHIAQEELWIYQGKLLIEHKTQKPNELISERYIYDDADRLLRVEYIQNGRLQKIKEF